MTDIGTGSYTILAQIASEILGIPVDRITMALGDTNARRPQDPAARGARAHPARRSTSPARCFAASSPRRWASTMRR